MSAPLTRTTLRTRLAHRLEEQAVPGRIVRVLPLGFPVLETMADLRVGVSEPLGLVERRLLLAVQQFGPADSHRLDEILGVGSDIIDEILQRIGAFEPQLEKTGGAWRLPASVDIAQVQQYSKDVVQRHKFVVNGLTGELLPVAFWKHRPREQLNVNREAPDTVLLDHEKRPTDVLWKLTNRAQDAVQGIASQLAATAAEKDRLGIPAQTREVLETAAGELHVRWLAAFLLVLADGSTRLAETRDFRLSLADERFASPEYWARALDGAPGFERWRLSPEVRGERLRDGLARTLPADWTLEWDFAHAALRLLLPADPAQADGSGPAPEENDTGFRWLGHLRHGWLWTNRTDELVPVLPGNAAAAGAQTVLRGIERLRSTLKDTPPGHPALRSLDLAEWWRQWTAAAEVGDEWKEAVEALPLESFILRAYEVRDREFCEKVEALAER